MTGRPGARHSVFPVVLAEVAVCAGFVAIAGPALAAPSADRRFEAIERRLAEQDMRLKRQEKLLRRQQAELWALRAERDQLRAEIQWAAAGASTPRLAPRAPVESAPAVSAYNAALAQRRARSAAGSDQAVETPAVASMDVPPPRLPEAPPPPALPAAVPQKRPVVVPPPGMAAVATFIPPDEGGNASLAEKRAAFEAKWLAGNTAMGTRQSTNAAPEDARNTPTKPVGEAPPPSEPQVRAVAALPEQASVLTPRGRFVFTPSFEYVHSSANRLVFRGVEIVPGIQLGVIEANDADRNSAVTTAALRYGLTRKLEVEARVPYADRFDRVTTVAQRDQTVSRSQDLRGRDIGDIEFAARYQLNEVHPGSPVYVASLRVKSPTGRGPYDVRYDEFGVAQELATGSGFWATEGGVTLLYPTDPAVIFASLSYLHNVPRAVNKTIGTAVVGRVEPGDSMGASMGFGLSLNPRFSVSFGYSHNYIARTRTQLNGAWQKSQSLQVGSLLMGWSFRLTDRLTLSNNFQFGVTSDAPDMEAIFSLPVRF